MRSKDKEKAINLRIQGLSYGQIQAILAIPKSTLSCWLKDIELSETAKHKILARVHNTSVAALIRRNKLQTTLAQDRSNLIRVLAKKEFRVLLKNKTKRNLFLTGVSLYWAEGYKQGAYGGKNKNIDFTNSDPKMVKLMLNFFTEICSVDKSKIKIQLMAHKNLNHNQAINFWSKLLKLPKNNFNKVYSLPIRPSSRPNRLAHGTVHLRFSDVKVFFRIIGWLDGLQEYFKV